MSQVNKKDNKTFTHEELLSALKGDGIRLTKSEIQKARNENRKTLYKIGGIYFSRLNYSKALIWYQKAASQNHSTAQNNIGRMYMGGQGVPEDLNVAAEWFWKAVNNDENCVAQCHIGQLYHYGLTVPKNIDTAMEWYKKSADKNCSYGQYMLGSIYEHEEELKDLEKAYAWYDVAGCNGYSLGQLDAERLQIDFWSSQNQTGEEEPTTTNSVDQIKSMKKETDNTIDDTVNNDQEHIPLINKPGTDDFIFSAEGEKSMLELIHAFSLETSHRPMSKYKKKEHKKRIRRLDEIIKSSSDAKT